LQAQATQLDNGVFLSREISAREVEQLDANLLAVVLFANAIFEGKPGLAMD